MNQALKETQKEVTRKRRVQFDFTPQAYSRLVELKNSTGASSNGEVIRRALHLLDVVTTKEGEKYKLVREDRDHEVDLLLL